MTQGENTIRKVKTNFEQVPVAVVKRIARLEDPEPVGHDVLCAICGSPVVLEHCKTDERGMPVHGNCYIRKMAAGRRSNAAKAAQ